MPTPFEGVRAALLRAGIAPRHARRYVIELREHLVDRMAHEREAGHAPEEAAARARAFLGTDAELAQALIDKGEFRSLAARVPWVVFIVLPLALLYAVSVALICLGLLGADISAVQTSMRLSPEARYLMFLVRDWTAPLVAAGCVIVALRQRMSPLWPSVSLFLMSVLFDGVFVERHIYSIAINWVGMIAASYAIYLALRPRWSPMSPLIGLLLFGLFIWTPHTSHDLTFLTVTEVPVRGILLVTASSLIYFALRRQVPLAVVIILPVISVYMALYATNLVPRLVPPTALWVVYVATDALGLMAAAVCIAVVLRQVAVALRQRSAKKATTSP